MKSNFSENKKQFLEESNNANIYLQSYIYGSFKGWVIGDSVSGIGDINGDSISDIVISTWKANPNGITAAGAVYIIYGSKNNIPNINSIENYLSDTTNGFKIYGSIEGWVIGESILRGATGAGDINGDSICDILISALNANPNGIIKAGAAYVIYGKKGGIPNINSIENYLSNTTNGFKIYGANENLLLGYSISEAGDINGDGISDIILGANGPKGIDGAVYIIYGKKGGLTNINSIEDYLSNTANGFKIYDSSYKDGNLGSGVSGAGDVNSDGIDDILISASNANPNGINGAGAAYIVYGKKGGIPKINSIENYLSNTTKGFMIYGSYTNWSLGILVSRAGDINGDGVDDILLGTASANPNGITEAGATYVIYGKKDGLPNINSIESYLLDTTKGFMIYGSVESWNLGISVSGVGNVNSDGISDIILGTDHANPNGITDAGAAYVIYGKKGGIPNINSIEDYLSVTANGFKIYGSNKGWNLGYSVSGAGDINSDGVKDIVLSAINADPNGITGAGAVYIVYGDSSNQNYGMFSEKYGNERFSSMNMTDIFGNIAVGNNPKWCKSESLYLGDFNGDHTTDLLCNHEGGNNYIMLSQDEVRGIMTFKSISENVLGKINIGPNYTWCDTSYQRLLLGDFNGDGKTDLLCNNNGVINTGKNYVMLSTGVNFKSMTNTSDGAVQIGSSPNSFCGLNTNLIIGNFDGKNGDDLLCETYDLGLSLMVYSNTTFMPFDNTTKGKVTMQSSNGKCNYTWVSKSNSKLITGDFNGDGKTDLLCKSNDKNYVLVSSIGEEAICTFSAIECGDNKCSEAGIINIPDGSIKEWCAIPARLRSGDFNGDGISDLICNDKGYNTIMIMVQYAQNGDKPYYYQFQSINGNNQNDSGNVTIDRHERWCLSGNLFIGHFTKFTVSDLWCNQNEVEVKPTCADILFTVHINSSIPIYLGRYISVTHIKLYSLPKAGTLFNGESEAKIGNTYDAGELRYQASNSTYNDDFQYAAISIIESIECTINITIFNTPICCTTSFLVNSDSKIVMNLTDYVNVKNIKLYSLPEDGFLLAGEIEAKIGNIYDASIMKYQAGNDTYNDSFQYSAINQWMESVNCTIKIDILNNPYNNLFWLLTIPAVITLGVAVIGIKKYCHNHQTSEIAPIITAEDTVTNYNAMWSCVDEVESMGSTIEDSIFD